MANLAFTVSADYEKVIRLRDEVARLHSELDKLQGNGSQQAIATLERQLAATQGEFHAAVAAAASFGTSIQQSVEKVQVSSVAEQINTLAYAIYQNEQAMAAGVQQLERWREEGEKAFAAGDSERVATLTSQINQQVQALSAVKEKTDEYRASLQGLTAGTVDTSLEGITSTVQQLDQACDLQRATIERLEAEYNSLCGSLGKSVAEGSAEEKTILERVQAISGEITVRRALMKEMQDHANALEATAGAMQKEAAQTEQAAQSHETLRSRIRAVREEMISLRERGIDETSDAYRRLSAELGRLQDMQSDVARQGSILANDQSSIMGLQSGIQGVTGAFMGMNGAIALVCGSNKTQQEVLVRSHSLMAVTNSLQQVAAVLNKDSAFRLVTLAKARDYWNKLLAIGRGEQVADTAATVADTVAKEAATAAETKNTAATGANTVASVANTGAAVAQTTATIGLAGAFRMLGAAIKSVPAFGWVIAAVAAVAAGVAALIKHLKKAGEASDEAKKKAQEFYKAVADGAYKPIGSIKMLQTQWDKLADDLKGKEKFIADNKNQFEALGLAIDDVSAAEKFFTSQAQTFIDAQIAKAKATVLLNQAMDKTKEAAELEMEIEAGTYANTKTNWLGMTTWTGELGKQKEKLEQLKKEAAALYEQAADFAKEGETLETAAGVDNTAAATDTVPAVDTAKDLSKETAKYKELVEKQGKERAREVTQMEFAIRQAQIDAMADSNAKTLAQIALDFEEQEVAIAQWYEDLKEKKIEKAKELWEANPATRDQTFDAASVDTSYTADEETLYSAQHAAAAAQRQKSTEEVYAAERAAMRDFLKDYGTYEQQRLAIAEEYAAKIAAAQTTGEKMSLTVQRDDALHTLDVEFIDNTQWDALFANIDNLSRDQLQKLQEELEAMLADETITLDQAMVLSNNLATVNKALVDRGNAFATAMGKGNDKMTAMKKLQEDILNYQRQINAATREQEQTLTDIEDIKQQICDLVEGKIDIEVNVDKLTIDNADAIISELEKSGDSTGAGQAQNLFSQWASLSQQSQQLGGAISSLTAGSDAAGAALEGMGGAAGGGASAIAMVDTIVHGINDGVQGMNELLDQMGLGDSKFGKGWQAFAESSEYATQGWESLKSGDVMGVVNGVYGSLRSLGDALGAWGISFMGETDKTLHEDMETLSFSNDALKASIDELSEEISKLTTSLSDAADDYATAMYNLEKMEQDTQEIMQRAGKNRDQGFLGIGSDASTNGKINKAMTSDDWYRISKAAGVTVTSAGDFWNLTSEQMYNVSVQEAALYAKIKQHADDGHDDVAQYMDEYIGYYQQLLDLQDEWNEKLTATSLDSLVSSFQSAIMDMEHTSADFANDFEELMKNAVVSSLVSNKYADMLSDWYDEFAEAMEDDYMISPSEQEKLREEYEDLVDAATDEVKQLYDLMGWSTTANTQTAQSTAWQTMSEDTGQELNGRFTAMYESLIRHETLSEGLAAQGDLLNDIAANTRDILASSYLELQEIRDNTERAADYLRGIRSDIAAVKENTEQI